MEKCNRTYPSPVVDKTLLGLAKAIAIMPNKVEHSYSTLSSISFASYLSFASRFYYTLLLIRSKPIGTKKFNLKHINPL